MGFEPNNAVSTSNEHASVIQKPVPNNYIFDIHRTIGFQWMKAVPNGYAIITIVVT